MIFEQLSEFVVGNVTFPLTSYLFNRKHILGTYRNLMVSQWNSADLLREMQLKCFRNVVRHANTWCPFYTDRFKEIGLEPEDIKTFEDIALIPILKKSEVMENHRDMVDTRQSASIPFAERSDMRGGGPIMLARFRRHKLIKNMTSGSTGTPTIFYDDGTMLAISWAHEFRHRAWFGLKPGTKEARLSALSTGFNPNSRALWMRKNLWHQLVLPGMNLSDEIQEKSLQQLNIFQPKSLWGITSALTGLADYIQDLPANSLLFHPEVVITRAAPVDEYERDLLEEVFEAPVSNNYGSKEVGHIANLCPHDALHINQEHYFLEESAEPVGALESGLKELLVTTLFESPMPFIRYQMGDLGEISPSNCFCGRGLEVIKNLGGRTTDVYITKDNRRLDVAFWGRAIRIGPRDYKFVKRWQVVYRINGDVDLRIVKNAGFSVEDEAGIKQFFDENLSDGTKVNIVGVSNIEPLPSGKYQMVVNEMNDSLDE